MITTYSNNTYRITYDGVSMVENALDNPNLVQISTVVGCTILVAPQNAEGTFEQDPSKQLISYLANGEYRRWTLSGRNTRVAKKDAHYIYARLNRNGSDALLVFSVNDYKVDGSLNLPSTEGDADEGDSDTTDGSGTSTAADTTTNPPSESYLYIKIGSISATDADYTSTATVKREVTLDFGYLSTAMNANEGSSSDWSKMFRLTGDNLILALKRLASFAVQGTLSIIGKLVLNDKQITDIARSVDEPIKEPDDETVPTTAFINRYLPEIVGDKFIRKDKDDETAFNLKVGSVESNNIGTKEFINGWLGVGGRMWVDELGKVNLEVDNIRARDTLETRTFRFNMIDVISGEMWNTFAYGTIKEVDTERQIVKLDLVEGELMTAHVNDFLRGIFHNIRIDNNISNEKDECGFEQIQGFTTAYFTPVSLLSDKTGFRYELRPGTKVHPCPGMKFAAYGNLTDKTRQATTYSTRTRLIMLENVNTWIIDPDRSYVYVRGDLEGLVFKGKKFHGHGTIQKNSYLYGTQIQFTEEQLDELRGNSTYSVSLSDYEGIIRTDLDGNVISGLNEVLNVVTEGENVITGSENVVTESYLLSTRIQAFKGADELFYSETAGKGMFYVSLNCIGCKAQVNNGVVEVTDVTDVKEAYIEMEVNCEGEAVFTKEYRITAVVDGYSPLYIDLDNQMDSIACNADGEHLFGEPETHVRCFYGTKELQLKELTATAPVGVNVTKDLASGLVKVNKPVAASVNDSFGVTIKASAEYETPQGRIMVLDGTAVFTINKVKTSAIFSLLPSVSAVKVSKDSNNNKSYSPTSVKCTLRKNDGTTTTELTILPANYVMKYSTDGGTEQNYTIGTNITVTSLTKDVTFYLRYAGVLIDVEKVPVVEDGDRAFNSFKSTVFIRTNSTPTTPTGGSYSSPIPTSSPTWSDGIPSGEEMLWASTRIFSENGVAPQQSTWTTPRQMTDTSDFDVAYHTGESYSGLPTSHHTANQGNGWTNTASEATIWMATDTKKNGAWAGWTVSKIKGEKGEEGKPGSQGAPGTPGVDATSYSISPSSLTLRMTSIGSVEPSSVTFYAYSKKGDGSFEAATGYWAIWGSNDKIPQPGEGTELGYASSSSSFTTDKFSRSYKYYNIMFNPTAYPDSSGDPVAVSCSATIVEDGKTGLRGAMPRARGLYDGTTTYYYNDDYRDIVYDSAGEVWMVNSYNVKGITGKTPSSSSQYWIQANKQIFTAIDTALIDGANIAGFGFKNGVMASLEGQLSTSFNPLNSKLILRGDTGYFKCVNAVITGEVNASTGSIGGFRITNRGISNYTDTTQGSEDAFIAIKNGSNYFHANYDTNVVLSVISTLPQGISSYNSDLTGTSVYAVASGDFGVAVHAIANGSNAIAVKATGAVQANAFKALTPNNTYREGITGAYRADNSDTWYVFDKGICVAVHKYRSQDLKTQNYSTTAN